VFLLAEVPLAGALPLGVLLVAEEVMVFAVFGLLEKKGMTLLELEILGGGEGVTVLWRFACNLVFLEPFLFG